MNERELINLALIARKNAYAPYSHYYVGAAVLAASGSIYTGCNIENASFGATNCAERTAVFKAVSEGEKKLLAIAIVGGADEESEQYAFPCGICRQVLREFSNPEELVVLVARSASDYKKYLLKNLLPESFGPEQLQ